MEKLERLYGERSVWFLSGRKAIGDLMDVLRRRAEIRGADGVKAAGQHNQCRKLLLVLLSEREGARHENPPGR